MNKLATGAGGFHPHDPIAAAYLIAPELFRLEELSIDVTASGLSRGKGSITPNGAQVKVALDIDNAQFLNLLLDRILR
jgi:inosine-uridine nucleoside N-ribohydrolase